MIKAHLKSSRAAGIPSRFGECNSASGGGTEGVSNVFASPSRLGGLEHCLANPS